MSQLKPALNETKVEITLDLQLDVVVLLLCSSLEHVERSTLGHEEHRSELKLSFD